MPRESAFVAVAKKYLRSRGAWPHKAHGGPYGAVTGTPDLLVHYHASITQRIDVNRVDREHGYCYGENCSVRVFEFETGTLVLDMVDTRTNRVIWRGWAQDSLQGLLDNPDRMARTINEAVRRMLEKFPPAVY